jgi:hypothetical protein
MVNLEVILSKIEDRKKDGEDGPIKVPLNNFHLR